MGLLKPTPYKQPKEHHTYFSFGIQFANKTWQGLVDLAKPSYQSANFVLVHLCDALQNNPWKLSRNSDFPLQKICWNYRSRYGPPLGQVRHNTLRSKQNGPYHAGDIFRFIYFDGNVANLIKFPLKCVSDDPIDDNSTFMWRNGLEPSTNFDQDIRCYMASLR